jgi:tRNA pseudouridine55 synthase
MMTLTTSDVSFVLPVDKPVGPTSHDIVGRARRALKTRRVGHTGTLDPFASGLLLLCVNNATRLAEYLTGLPKTYEAELLLGAATDTDDHTGSVYATSEAWRSLTELDVTAAFARWTGDVMQTPSQYTAKKVDGVRAYDAARRGETVDLPASPVTIYAIELLSLALPLVSFRVHCSSGTYIRALARDVGNDLGVSAHLTSLRRTAIGPHDVAGAVPLDALDDDALVSARSLRCTDAVSFMPRVDVDDAGLFELSHGRVVKVDDSMRGLAESTNAVPPSDLSPVALVHNGELVAIGRRDGNVLRPKKVLVNG